VDISRSLRVCGGAVQSPGCTSLLVSPGQTATSALAQVRASGSPPYGPPPLTALAAGRRSDKVEWSNGANSFSVDIHEKDDGYVYTCVYAERNGDVLVDEIVRVKGEVATVDEDAPPGNGPGSPCTESHGEGGTSTNRAYVRSTPSDTWPATVCAGVESSAGNRHVRILIG